MKTFSPKKFSKLGFIGLAFLFAIAFAHSALATDPPPRADRGFTYSSLPTPLPDSLTGALTYDYPITVPPGRNGLQPDLKLQYNNQDISQNSIFGFGWSLSIPYIQRLNKEGSDKLYTKDYYYSSLSGELATTTPYQFRSKTDNGEFLNYATSSNAWIVKDKQGTTYTFGNATTTQQYDPSDSTKIYKWMLAQTADANGNSITYEYYKDAGQIYPSAIKYTHSATSTDGIFEIDFLRESRSDVATSTATAFTVVTHYRINEIQEKISGSLVRKYALAYMTGDNGHRSLLHTITETGYDESGTATSLPATVFDSQSATNSWSQGNWTIPSDIHFRVWSDTSNTGVEIADVNGDGLADLVKAFNGSEVTYLNTGAGWAASSTWALPVDFGSPDRGTRLVDINGDGLVDIVKASCCAINSPPIQQVYLNTGAGWTLSSSWTFPSSSLVFIDYFTGNDLGVRLFDVNGDGLPDLVQSRGGATASQNVYINNGINGWSYNSAWSIPSGIYFADFYGVDMGVRMEDVNNDGLLDFVQAKGGTENTYLNTGTGWVLDPTWVMPVDFIDSTSVDLGVRFNDVNSDGLVDVVKSISSSPVVQQVYLNTGAGWTLSSSWTFPSSSLVFVNFPYGEDQGTRLADINGDGVPDFIYSYQYNGGDYQSLYFNNHKVADAITSITYPQGGGKSAVYKSSALYKDSSGNLLNPNLPLILNTVATTTESDGLGLTSTKTYTYANGKFYFNGYLDRKYSGFGTVTETNDAGTKTTTSYHGGTQSESSKGEYQDNIAKAGKPYRVEVRDASANLYSLQINKWDRADLGNGASFVKLVQTVHFTYDGDSSHKEKAESTTYNDSNGNATEKIQWGQVSGSDDGTFSDSGTDKFTTDFTYASDTNSIIFKVATATTTDQSGNSVRGSRWYYDNQSLGHLTNGNLTKEEQWKAGSTYVNTQKTYNAYGLVTQDTDPRGKATGYSYDSFNLYVATSTDPLGHSTGYLYDYTNGKPKQTTDANNLVFQTVFDGLDRVTAEKQPDLTTPSTLVTKTAYAFTNLSVGLETQRTDYLNAATSTDTFTYTDGLGHTIQTRKEAETTNTFAVADTVYNNLGQVQKSSLPYFSRGTSSTAVTATSTLYTVFGYDPLLRIASIANAAGTTTNAYEDWETTITDPRGKQKNLYKDAYDNLVKVEELNGTSTYTTLYEYDGNKNLTKITDASSNIRNFTYDGLGRRLTAQDLHASGDGTYGTWNYTYDDAGNTTQTVDPKSQTVNYTYDDINRVVTEDYTGQAGTEQTFAYDTCTNGKPRLCSVTSATATTTFAYNPLGQKQQEIKTINGTNYETDYTYDRQNNLAAITNPDSSVVKYTYNTAGQLETIQRKEAGDSAFTDVVLDFDYGPDGKVTYQENANGTVTNNTYDAVQLYWLKNRKTTYGVGGVETGLLDASSSYDLSAPLDASSTGTIDPLSSSADTSLSTDVASSTDTSLPADNSVFADTSSSTDTLLSGDAASSSTDALPADASSADSSLSAAASSTDASLPADASSLMDAASSTPAADIPLPIDVSQQSVAANVPVSAPQAVRKGWNYIAAPISVMADGNTQYRGEFYGKWINYRTPTGWVEINTDFSETKKGFEIQNAPFEVTAPLRSTGTAVMHNDNRWDVFKGQEINEAPLDMSIQAIGVNDVPGRIVRGDLVAPTGLQHNVSYVLYEGAYPQGDLIYYVDFGRAPRLEKLIRFASEPALKQYSFAISYSADMGFRSRENGEDSEWSKASALHVPEDDDVKVAENGSTIRGIGFKKFQIWDSNTNALQRNIVPIKVDITPTSANSYTLTKILPDSFFAANPVYPVYTDTTSTFYPDPSTETTSMDGQVKRNYDGVSQLTWADVHDGTGVTAITNETLIRTGISWRTTGYSELTHGYLLFDTSALTSGVTISAGTLSLYGYVKSDDNSKSPTFDIYTSTPASNTTLVASDYHNIGTTSQTGSAMTYASFSTTAYNDFTLNATGIGNISKTGISKFGTREVTYDVGNVDPSMSGSGTDTRIVYDSADYAGTDHDPKLVVTYAPVNQAPTAPTSLQIESQTNPVEVVNSAPKFSSIYNDPNTGDLATHYQIQVATSTNFMFPFWDSAKMALASSTPESMRSEQISYAGSAMASSTPYYWRMKFWDNSDAEGAWSTATSTFSLNNGPSVPTNLLTEGTINPINVTNAAPKFSAIYNDSDTSDFASYYRLQVATSSSDWISPYWDSQKTALTATTTQGTRSQDISYAGSSLISNTTYYWRIKFWDDSDMEGSWSTATSSFEFTTGSGIQNLTYSYDADGNITQIVDVSATNSFKIMTYAYDDLNRLTSASSAYATSTSPGNFIKTYGYDALGNIATSSDSGAYAYAGTGYANPHAATSIRGVANAYDNNGNLTSQGPWTYSWDYQNRMTSAGNGTATSTYAYDNTGQRVSMATGGITTVYPTKYFNKTTATSTKHIFTPQGELIASVTTTGASTTVQFIHTDHLSGSSIATDPQGNVVQLTDYFPYGSMRIDSKTGSFDEQRKYIGQEYDRDTALSYLNARYYNDAQGRFLSEDPSFLSIDSKSKDLLDPQNLNSYAYARDNPIVNRDPDGKSKTTFLQGAGSFLTYAYNNPVEALGVVALSTAAVIAAPAVAAVAGAALGGYAIGSSLVNAYYAPNADTRDYYLGQGLSAAALTGMGMKGASSALPNEISTTAEANSAAIHGNSLNSPKLNYGYQLIDKDTGETLKYGITGNDNPLNRYSKSQYQQMNARMEVLTQGSRVEMRSWETQQIKTYESQTGSKPALNKTYH